MVEICELSVSSLIVTGRCWQREVLSSLVYFWVSLMGWASRKWNAIERNSITSPHADAHLHDDATAVVVNIHSPQAFRRTHNVNTKLSENANDAQIKRVVVL
jgi:hypothetical protein